MKGRILWLMVCLIGMCSVQAANGDETGRLLDSLDRAIKNRPYYIRQKEEKLALLKKGLRRSIPDEERFSILGTLLEEYKTFNVDSALAVVEQRLQVGRKLGRQDMLDYALMNKAEMMSTAGMYKESLDVMQSIPLNTLPAHLRFYYYRIYCTVYGMMTDYVVGEKEKSFYSKLSNCYRDSCLRVGDERTLDYVLVKADMFNVAQKYDETIALLSPYSEGKDLRNVAVSAYTIAEAYRRKHDAAKGEVYLIRSAIADMESGTREYISLRKLAVLLYKERDIDRAYNYLTLCMNDAKACNARLRILEILETFPIVNDAYQEKIDRQQAKMKVMLVVVSLLSVFLLLTIFYVYKQMKRVAVARKEVIEANNRLKKLNEELHASNEKLRVANHSIAENSYLKEAYIGRYMDQCSNYLEKMDNYRRSLGKIAAAGNLDELYRKIKSSKFIDEELEDFYANFDNTFLQLFPMFVEEFNALLADGEQLHPKPNERMSTELRIFALIRLGITDSTKIAQFLRYSLTTIYNYRTKVRNKAAGNRDLLEKEVMKIGTSTPVKTGDET